VFLRIAILPARNDDLLYLNSLPFYLTQVQNGSADYNYLALLKTVAMSRLTDFSLAKLADYSFYPFGALLCLLPFFSIRRNLKWLAIFWPFLLLVYAQLLFAVSTLSLLFLALPVLVILAVTGLEVISQRFSVHPLILLCLPAATFLLNLIKPEDNADFKWLGVVLVAWIGLVFILNRLPNRSFIKETV
jgi:hypothetical protein